MANQDEQLQKILKKVDELQSEVQSLTKQVAVLKAQNELTNCHFRELYKTQSLEELLKKMSSIGKDVIHADECVVYGVNDDEFSKLLNLTGSTSALPVFFLDGDRKYHTMLIPLEDQQGDIIGIVSAKRGGDKMFTETDAKVFNLNKGELGAIFRVSLEQKIAEEIAVTDNLTKLKNRDGMSKYIREDVLSRVQENAPVCAVMFDIDHFKRFNDTYGHDVGDKCLKLVASTLKNNVRSDSGVFRWGGEEMIVILPVNEEKAFEIAERLRHAVEAASLVVNEKSGKTTQVTVSGGVSEFTPKSIELDKNRIESAFERCLKEADNALYKAKEDGRNRVYGSAALMQDHYSLPSPTELFQYWYDMHKTNINQNLILITADKDNQSLVIETGNSSSGSGIRYQHESDEDINKANSKCIHDIIGTSMFRDCVVGLGVRFIETNNLMNMVNGLSKNDSLAEENKNFARLVIEEWERVRNTVDQETFNKCYASVEAIKAMIYTPELINIKEIVDDRREVAMTNLDVFFQKRDSEWWNGFKKAYLETAKAYAETAVEHKNKGIIERG